MAFMVEEMPSTNYLFGTTRRYLFGGDIPIWEYIDIGISKILLDSP
jgi:hypothetical protein